jgi:hypothetical protein
MLLMVLTHNLAIILLVKELFYRAGQIPFGDDRWACVSTESSKGPAFFLPSVFGQWAAAFNTSLA